MVVGRGEALEGSFLVEVGVKFEGNVWEEVSSGAAGAKGEANGEIGALVVVGGLRQKTLHQAVKAGGGGAKGGIEVVSDAVADLASNDRGKHGATSGQENR